MARYAPFVALLVCMVMALVAPTVVEGTRTGDVVSAPAMPKNSTPARLNQAGGTTQEYCSTFALGIPDNQANGITSTISVGPAEVIQDLNVLLDIDHTNVGDLRIALSRGATSVVLVDRPRLNGDCDGNDMNNVIADDEAGVQSLQLSCDDAGGAYQNGGSYLAGSIPNSSILSVYDGGLTNGDWRLNIRDNAAGTTGTLQRWCVQFTIATPTPTATRTPSPLPPTATPTNAPPSATPSATPTEPPPPTNTATPTATNTPQVPPTVTPTPTITPTPDPDRRSTYLASSMKGVAAGNCQSVENESLFPNNTIGEARSTRPLCRGEGFQGIHNISDNREDIFRLVVAEGETGLYRFALDVPDINLSLRLYDNDVNELAFSTNPDTQDEQFELNLLPGTYFVRVYRADELISEQPYRLTITP